MSARPAGKNVNNNKRVHQKERKTVQVKRGKLNEKERKDPIIIYYVVTSRFRPFFFSTSLSLPHLHVLGRDIDTVEVFQLGYLLNFSCCRRLFPLEIGGSGSWILELVNQKGGCVKQRRFAKPIESISMSWRVRFFPAKTKFCFRGPSIS